MWIILDSARQVTDFLAKTKLAIEDLMDLATEPVPNPDASNLGHNSTVHSHAEMATISKEVIQQLKMDNENVNLAEDGFDQYMEDLAASRDDGRELPVANPNLLNQMQKIIYDRFRQYFYAKKEFIEGRAQEQPDPIQNLIHGGPGKQKSFKLVWD